MHINPKLAGMGTTVTALLLAEGKLHFAHIGDSRAYRLRDGEFEQISVDHTFVQRLIDEGRLRPEEAETHPHKNVLMRVLGDVDASPELDLDTLEARQGDRWLLCSDGLNYVAGHVVERTVRETKDLRECAETLVDLTLEAGSPDNVTVVVLDIVPETPDDVSTAAVDIIMPAPGSKPAAAADAGTAAAATSAADGPNRRPPRRTQTGGTQERRQFRRSPERATPTGTQAPLNPAAQTHTWANTSPPRSCAKSSPPARTNWWVRLRPPRSPGPFPPSPDAPWPGAQQRSSPTRPNPAVDAADTLVPLRPRRWVTWSIAAAVLVVVAVGLWLGYAWTQTRYYVGEFDSRVAIYNGVSQRLGPIQLSSLEAVTDIRMDSLPAVLAAARPPDGSGQRPLRRAADRQEPGADGQHLPGRGMPQSVRFGHAAPADRQRGSADDIRRPRARTASIGDPHPHRLTVTFNHTHHHLRGGQMSQVSTAPKPRRNVELLLLLLALTVGIGANVLVGVDQQKAFDSDFWFQSSLLAAASLAFHGVLRFRAKYADPVILPLVVALNGLGLAMIHRLDPPGGDTGNNQLRWTLIAMAVSIAVIWFLKDHRVLRRFTFISLAASAVLLVLPLVPGISAGEILGARVWIRVGPMTFQPGEIAKITLAIFFAGYLSSNRDLILLAGRKVGPLQFPRFKDLGPMVAAWLVSIGVLVFQSDLGSSVLFFGLFIVMIYVATSRISWVVIGMALLLGGGLIASQMISHVGLRIDGWLNAFTDEVYGRAYGGSFQIVEGLFGMANGGLVGTGLGQGRPDLVPFANSDMIIASLGEELGLIGLFAVVLMYLLLFTRGFRAALGTRDAFGKLLACGLSFAVALQCFVVIGGVTRLIPLTGLTTPFLAAGGSSLLANWIIVGLLLMISHTARGPVDTTPLPPSAGSESTGIDTPTEAVKHT